MGLRLAARRAGYVPANRVMAVRVASDANDGERRDDRMRNEVRQRNEAQQQADADAADEAADAADQGDDGGLDQELALDVDGGCAERFADADLARALGDGDQHDVHHADAAKRERQQSDGAEEERHHAEDALGELDAFERVPDPESFFVVGLVVVALGDDLACTWFRRLLMQIG